MAYSAALRRYEEQYDALKAELETLGFVGQGSVHTRRITCGRAPWATCRCHDDPDARHGPYHYWTRKARGKTVGLNLHLKTHGVRKRLLQTPQELKRYVLGHMRSLQRTPALLRGFFKKPSLRYITA